MILSWDNVVAGGRNDDDGMNVVFHEFAHQIDQYNGVADGVPISGTARSTPAGPRSWGATTTRSSSVEDA